MTTYLLMSHIVLCLAVGETAPSAEGLNVRGLPNAFFAMNTATADEKHQTAESQMRMVKQLGFAGWACHLQDMTEPLKLADELGLKIFAVYTGLDLDKPEAPWEARLPEEIKRLKGHGTAIWLFVLSKQKGGTADDAAIKGIQRIADMAAESGLVVSLYSHNGFYMASTRDALRLAKRVERPNVKVTFNLCHWLKVDGGKDLDAILKEALPWLDMVTINGADKKGEGWDQFIKPLGDGDFDVCGLLARLKKLGFKGPVGLQGYGIKGDVHKHLTQAMRVWRAYAARLAGNGAGGSEPAK